MACRKYPQRRSSGCRDFGPYLVLNPFRLSDWRRTGTRTACAYEGITVTTARHDDEADDTDGVFRRRKSFEHITGWVAYVVALS